MAVLIDRNTRLLVQGLTGREGTFHGTRNADKIEVSRNNEGLLFTMIYEHFKRVLKHFKKS